MGSVDVGLEVVAEVGFEGTPADEIVITFIPLLVLELAGMKRVVCPFLPAIEIRSGWLAEQDGVVS